MAEAASTTFAGPAESLPSNLFTCPSLNMCINPHRIIKGCTCRPGEGTQTEPEVNPSTPVVEPFGR